MTSLNQQDLGALSSLSPGLRRKLAQGLQSRRQASPNDLLGALLQNVVPSFQQDVNSLVKQLERAGAKEDWGLVDDLLTRLDLTVNDFLNLSYGFQKDIAEQTEL